jgi:hypothetical protein
MWDESDPPGVHPETARQLLFLKTASIVRVSWLSKTF